MFHQRLPLSSCDRSLVQQTIIANIAISVQDLPGEIPMEFHKNVQSIQIGDEV
jgi:hypothetical protein